MTLRSCTVEHPFVTIKAWMGATHFLTRRLKNVRTEIALNVLAYSIKRMVALMVSGGSCRRSRDKFVLIQSKWTTASLSQT